MHSSTSWFKRFTLLFYALSVLILLCHVLLQQLHWYINTTESLPYGIYKAHYIEHTTANQNLHLTLAKLPKNTLVLLCLDEPWSEFARQRGYIGQGKCPNFTAPLGKHLVALGGDQVKFSQEGIFVNQQLIQMTRAASKDEYNRPLELFHGQISKKFLKHKSNLPLKMTSAPSSPENLARHLKQQFIPESNATLAKEESPYENKVSTLEYEMVLKDDEVIVCNFNPSSFDSRYFGPVHIQNIIATLTPFFTW